VYYVDKEKCIDCKICLNICPQKAISIKENKAFIDVNKCSECGKCYHACPYGAIFSDAQPNQNNYQNQTPIFSIPLSGSRNSIRKRGLGKGFRNGRGRGKGRR